jgi:4-hydroxy-2-oxoglutarate aldolase
MPLNLRGVFAPLPTTFDPASGDVDPAAMAANVTRLMSSKLAGVLALGSNGETPMLDDDESDRIVEAVRASVPRDRTFLVGAGKESTRGTIASARRFAELGADAVLVRPPFYYKAQMTADALVAHFRATADASRVPVLLYNLPGTTGFTLTPPMVAALADHPNIIGLKETSPELERLGTFTTFGSGRFHVLSGWAPVLYPAIAAGAVGGILAIANVLPDECAKLCEAAAAGRHDDALARQRELTPIAQLVSSIHSVAGLKHALDLIGQHGGPVRPPLLALNDRARDEIAHALAAFRAGPHAA